MTRVCRKHSVENRIDVVIVIKSDLLHCRESDLIEFQNNYREFLKNAKFIFDIYSFYIAFYKIIYLQISIIRWYIIRILFQHFFLMVKYFVFFKHFTLLFHVLFCCHLSEIAKNIITEPFNILN